jgi:hypothetical protein
MDQSKMNQNAHKDRKSQGFDATELGFRIAVTQ